MIIESHAVFVGLASCLFAVFGFDIGIALLRFAARGSADDTGREL